MPDHNHFLYDPESCEFIPVRYNRRKKFSHTLSLWIIYGVLLICIAFAVLSLNIHTPAELALKAENKTLIEHLQSTESSITDLEEMLESMAELDNELYRSVLGLDRISTEERQAGTGGADLYSNYDFYSKDASDVLRQTSFRLDRLERRLAIQKTSLNEVKSYYNENQERLRHLPAIKPVDGIITSGYGMRMHPVLKYNRMHEGVDFRADLGTEIYATGDGVVKFSGRRGTAGLLVIIDHGFGYTTHYAHLSGFADGIRPGERVKRGDLIAYSGNTGLSQGPHLHYEVHVDGKPVDPLSYLFADISPEEYLIYKQLEENSSPIASTR